jgi:hypothetical protein
MLNKTILVFYINVCNLNQEEVTNTIENIRNLIKPSEEDRDDVIHYIIPVRDQETKIECINAPIFITSKDMEKEVNKKMEIIDKKLDRITSYVNANAEIRKVIIEKK